MLVVPCTVAVTLVGTEGAVVSGASGGTDGIVTVICGLGGDWLLRLSTEATLYFVRPGRHATRVGVGEHGARSAIFTASRNSR